MPRESPEQEYESAHEPSNLNEVDVEALLYEPRAGLWDRVTKIRDAVYGFIMSADDDED